MNEDELVARARAGDKAAMATLFDRYSDAVLAQARRLANNDEEAEDIVAEALVKALMATNLRINDANHFRNQLYLFAYQAFCDRYRAKRKNKDNLEDVSLDSIAIDPADPVNPFLRVIDLEDAEEALCRLPEKERQVLHLFYWEEMSYVEIAEALAIPLSKVKVLIPRAKRRLRKFFGLYDNDGYEPGAGGEHGV